MFGPDAEDVQLVNERYYGLAQGTTVVVGGE